MADILPPYPPNLTPQQLDFLVASLKDYCLSHGITIRPATSSDGDSSAIHAPVTLFPSLFPRSAWEQAIHVQKTYNILYARIANDVEWLGKIMDELVDVDDFVKQLWDLYKEVRQAGIVQPWSLGMFRSDYMIDADPSEESPTPTIKQVEFNTISSSFGGLSSQVTKLHNPAARPEALPDNDAAEKLAGGLAAAVRQYETHGSHEFGSSVVLFVVQKPERNAFDQRWLEYHLLEKHEILTSRMTLAEIASSAILDDNRRLLIPRTSPGQEWMEVGVVYLRAGYGPGDYPSQVEWNARRMLELSAAIKCPTVITQLAGCKKVQQVLSEPDVLDRFLTPTEATSVKKTFTRMYPMNNSEYGRKGISLAFESPDKYVLKPQREGGGNNIYRSDIPGFLKSLPNVSHYNAYILMELIQPPPLSNSIIREGKVITGPVIGELGVYGTIVWHEDGRTIHNEMAGWLLRTKGKGVNEGGVAAGFGCVDSVCLYDE